MSPEEIRKNELRKKIQEYEQTLKWFEFILNIPCEPDPKFREHQKNGYKRCKSELEYYQGMLRKYEPRY
jgi:hypothetical protein